MHHCWYLGLVVVSFLLCFSKTAGLDLQPIAEGEDTPNNSNCTCVPKYLCKNDTVTTSIGGEGIIDIRRNNGTCKNYLLTCCKKEDQLAVPLTASHITSPKGCGYRRTRGVGFQITGNVDNESQFGEFPWMVAVFGNGNYQCGGSLIHPNTVITAAHCVTNKDKKFSIRAGEWDTQHVNEPYPHQDREVKSIKIHPKYYSGALFYDIAFLLLDTPVTIADNVDVACLPPQNYTPSVAQCYASGWGQKVFDHKENTDGYQVILKRIELPFVPRDLCQVQLRSTRLGKHFILNESFVCAGGKSGKDTCVGDGGSPLVCPVEGQEDRYLQSGIVSWGIGCGSENVPGVYANVGLFRGWIDEQMGANGLDVSSYQF